MRTARIVCATVAIFIVGYVPANGQNPPDAYDVFRNYVWYGDDCNLRGSTPAVNMPLRKGAWNGTSGWGQRKIHNLHGPWSIDLSRSIQRTIETGFQRSRSGTAVTCDRLILPGAYFRVVVELGNGPKGILNAYVWYGQ